VRHLQIAAVPGWVKPQAAERAPDAKVIRFHLAMAQLHMELVDRAHRGI
jgi:hypothetical protein